MISNYVVQPSPPFIFFFITANRNSVPFKHWFSISPAPNSTLVTSNPLSASMIFHVNGIIQYLCLASFAWQKKHVFKVHLTCNIYQNFISFYGWTTSHCRCITFYLPIHLFMGPWVLSTFWLLWIILQSTLACRYLIEWLFSVVWVYPKGWNCWVIW